MDDKQLMKRVARDQLRSAQREVEKARKRFLTAKAAVERASARGRDAADALEEAEHKLKLVRMSQRSAGLLAEDEERLLADANSWYSGVQREEMVR